MFYVMGSSPGCPDLIKPKTMKNKFVLAASSLSTEH